MLLHGSLAVILHGWRVKVQGDAVNVRDCVLTVQAHNWRCLRCTFNTGKGITAAKSRCTQVRSPGLFVLKGGEAGESACRVSSPLQEAQRRCRIQPSRCCVSPAASRIS